ncbi:MAG: hypothetical protein ACK475_09315 [Bacteroidota bacterium]|jgi:hypothetical protein
MNDERFEPKVEHEYIVTFSAVVSEAGQQQLMVHVMTTREFTSYAYSLGLTAKLDLGRTKLSIEVGGLSIPTMMMPAAKGAFGERALVMPPDGSYDVELTRRSSQQRVVLHVQGGRPVNVSEAADGGFALFRIAASSQE